MLTRKSPTRARLLTGAAVVTLAALGAGYAAWAAQPQHDVLIQAAAPVIQLAQADAPPPGAHVVKRVTINKNGVTQTYEGDAIPADIQVEIDAADASGEGAHKVVRIIRHGDGAEGDLSALDTDVLVKKLTDGDGAVHVLKIQCEKTAADAQPVCTTLEGDPAEAAAAIDKMKAEGLPGGGKQVFILRHEQR